MLLLVQELCEGHLINLQNDKYADPEGHEPAFARHLRVHSRHQGPPTTMDEHKVFDGRNFFYFGTPNPPDEEGIGVTLIVHPHGAHQLLLLYFPDGEHEVQVIEADDDDDFD